LAIGVGVFALMTAVAVTAQELVSIDIGDAVDTPGSTAIDGDTYTIEGNGSDIWNAADGFRYAYTEVSGDFEAIVHQLSTDLPKEWSKGGIHARQSTDAGAQNAQAIVTGGGASGAQLTWRTDADGSTSEFEHSAPGPWKDGECWVKLTRAGNEFHGYISEDGSNWQDLLSVEVVMVESILVGIAVCGVGVAATATYDGFTVVADGVTVFPHLADADVDPRGKAAATWGEMKAR
jgi:hypothetical protein